MCVSTGGAASIKSLQGPETVLGPGSFEAAAALTSFRLDELQLAVEGVNLSRDVEDTSVRLVIAGNLGRQPPIVGASCQIHGLVVGRRFPADSVDKPHWEWLGGGVADIGGCGVQVVLEDGVAFLTEGTEGERDRAIAQFNIARLAHDVVGIRDDEIGEPAMILLEPFGALCVGLTRHLGAEIGELLAELFNLGFCLEMLEGAANGRVGEADSDGAKGAGVELWMPLHDIEGALR